MKKQTVSKIVLKIYREKLQKYAQLNIFLIVVTLFISLTLTSLIQAHALAATYYVSTTGNDANNGLSLNTPFRAIQKSASVSNPGDTIEIQPGTYNEQVTITKSGLVNQLITFHANGQVIIDAQNTRAYGIKIAGADYIKIEGFNIRNAKDNGILLTNSANYPDFDTFEWQEKQTLFICNRLQQINSKRQM